MTKLNITVEEEFQKELDDNILYPLDFSFNIPSVSIHVNTKFYEIQI